MILLLLTAGCATSRDPLPTPPYVDLQSFMGAWYVVGYTPILVDKEAHNAVEHYYLAEDGRILTTYQFRKGGFDGALKTYTPVGTVHNKETNAEWRMQFLWPFKSPYIILYLSPEKDRTIIAHPNRKYAWIMQREPQIAESDYAAMLDRLREVGYDPSLLQRVPHDWSHEPERWQRTQAVGRKRPLGKE